MLQGLVDFDGYYLESDPCLVCNNPEVPYTVSMESVLLLSLHCEYGDCSLLEGVLLLSLHCEYGDCSLLEGILLLSLHCEYGDCSLLEGVLLLFLCCESEGCTALVPTPVGF